MSGPGRVTRRTLLRGAGASLLAPTSAAVAATVRASAQAPGASALPVHNVAELGADRSGARDVSAIFQQAIDAAAPSGGIIYVPAGIYRLERTLVWENPRRARGPGITWLGDGMHSTILRSRISDGPVLRVRGVPARGQPDTSFFWGGGLSNLTIEGNNAAGQHGLEILGWYHGAIENCGFSSLGGDGIRARTDLRANPNPDFTSSLMLLRGVRFERLGGWGFLDMSDVQGAPGWSWDRCVFALCRLGGASIRSGAHSFTKCSFSGCGWLSESGPAGSPGHGLRFDGAASAASQHWIEGCEFDTNRAAHVAARFLAASTFINNRFIFNDRYQSGRISPPVGIAIGEGDARATVRGVEFRQSFFRFDIAGAAVAFDFVNHANVRDVEIAGSVFTQPRGGRVQRYRGHDPGGRGAEFGYVIRDREGG